MNFGEAIAILDEKGVEWLCDQIIEGSSLRTIAKGLGMNVSTLTRWVGADGERAIQVREARVASARAFDELALEGILKAKNKHQLGIAKEAAHHLRWRASKINPRDYGDKLEIDQRTTVSDLTEAQIDARLAALRAKAQPDGADAG